MKESLIKGDKIPFTQVANAVLNDKKLSWKAKGLYAYLYSKPHNWDFSGERIAYDSKEGRRAVYASLKELEQAGYLHRERKPNGKMVYSITIKPLAPLSQEGRKPLVQKRKELKQQSAVTGSISNKENTSNNEKKITPPSPQRGMKGRVRDEIQNNSEMLMQFWDASGDAKIIAGNMEKKVLYRGEELLNKYPALISKYLMETDHPGWNSQIAFEASMRNLVGAIYRAGIEKISVGDWENALYSTAHFDYRTIKTIINAL